jgi:hypothetical protein
MIRDTCIHRDGVLVLIWLEIPDQIFRQVKELGLFHKAGNRPHSAYWQRIEIKLEPGGALFHEATGAFKSNFCHKY